MDQLRNRHFLLLDMVLLPVAVYLSYVLRLERFGPSSRWWPGMMGLAICVMIVTPIVFRRAGVYSRFWRYASVNEVMLLTGAFTVATLIATGAVALAGYLLVGSLPIPRSIPFILLLLGLAVTAGPRLLARIRSRRAAPTEAETADAQPVLIMGAGDTGATMAREIQHNPQLGMRVAGFLDDDPQKHHVVIHGVPVLGDRHAIRKLAQELGIQQVIIAMPTASGKDIRDVVRLCEEARVRTRTVPGMPELLDGRVSVSQVREVRIDDLLRREPIVTDMAAVSGLIAGKRVLITGGGGSIGGELARQVQQCGPDELMLLGHGENSIFAIYHELLGKRTRAAARGGGRTRLFPVIADIRSAEQMQRVMERFRPDIVFHAAAHKHVPLMEMNPGEAVLNNVGGTRALLRAAEQAGVPRFVMVSTDKAVNPSSVMGATKRVAEMVVQQAARRSGRAYVTVRFGNVLGSRGSVVPTFQQQIAAGGPVTVTHPDVKRYFMTIPEAVQLLLQASVLGRGGELFMLDMGEPIRIADLATDLIRLSGLEVGRDIDIVYTGLRPGEKLFEEMFMAEEHYGRTGHEQIFVARNGLQLVQSGVDQAVEDLLAAARTGDAAMVIRRLVAIVPEYAPERSSAEEIAAVEVAAGA